VKRHVPTLVGERRLDGDAGGQEAAVLVHRQQPGLIPQPSLIDVGIAALRLHPRPQLCLGDLVLALERDGDLGDDAARAFGDLRMQDDADFIGPGRGWFEWLPFGRRGRAVIAASAVLVEHTPDALLERRRAEDVAGRQREPVRNEVGRQRQIRRQFETIDDETWSSADAQGNDEPLGRRPFLDDLHSGAGVALGLQRRGDAPRRILQQIAVG
jgi:hypothetical protein